MTVNARHRKNTGNYNPYQWGPHVWATLHTLALKADATKSAMEEELAFKTLVMSLQTLLPCDSCKDHLNDYVSGNPIEGSKFEWTINLHNAVNQRLNRPVISLDQAYEQWTSSTCSYSCSNAPLKKQGSTAFTGLSLCGLFVAMVVLYYFVWRTKPLKIVKKSII